MESLEKIALHFHKLGILFRTSQLESFCEVFLRSSWKTI